MGKIIFTFKTEIKYFGNNIDEKLRKIIFSNIFQIISGPIISIFISAFIWGTTHSLLDVVIYNIGNFLFLPIAFYLNGLLLQKIDIRVVFTLGAVCVGLSSIIVVFLNATNLFVFFLCGIIYGLGNGFYWANRNYLVLQETVSGNRQYYFSLIYSASWIANVLVPFIAGWFIILSQHFGLFTKIEAYWILFIISLLLMIGSAIAISRGNFESPIPKNISRFKMSKILNQRHILSTSNGVVDGIGFVSTLLILYILGNEGILGTITAIISIITGCVIYIYGRQKNHEFQHKALIFCSLAFLMCSLILALFPQSFGVLVYVLLSGIFTSFFGLILAPIILSLVEKEMRENIQSKYSFIFDNEVYLNLGRLIGLLLIVGITVFNSQVIGLFYGPLLLAVTQIIFLVVSLKIKIY